MLLSQSVNDNGLGNLLGKNCSKITSKWESLMFVSDKYDDNQKNLKKINVNLKKVLEEN